MRTGNVLGYLGLALVAAGAVGLAARLALRHARRFLLHYALALGFAYSFGLLDIVGYLAASELLARQAASPGVHATVSFVFHLLAFPALVLGWYFFARTFLDLRGIRVRPGASVAWFAVQGALVAAYAAAGGAGLARFPLHKTAAASTILLVLNLANRLLIFALIAAAALARGPAAAEPDGGRGLKRFATLYVAAYLAYGLAAALMRDRGFVCFTYPVAEFFCHLPPLLYLAAFLERSGRARRDATAPRASLAAFFDRLGLTGRERDVAALLLQGRSGREIADRLFISIKTVKTHAGSVYRKAGVRGRWGLIAAAEAGGRRPAAAQPAAADKPPAPVVN